MSFIDVVSLGVFSTVNDAYEAKEIDVTQRVGYSIQRLSLESSLNDRFDSVQRRITVSNSSSSGGNYVFNEAEVIASSLEIYVFNEAESLPVGASENYIFNETEPSGSAISPFFVYCPLDISLQERQIRAWIEAVQVTGTSYELIFM